MARPSRIPRSALLATIVASAAAATALADPPPFLPPSLQKIVEDAREQHQAPAEPVERHPDLRAVVLGELTFGEVIDRLGSDDLAVRESATSLLASVPLWDETLLARALGLSDICAETRLRLECAIFSRFANSPRPAVGIQMVNGAVNGAIKIDNVFKGFPAERVLQKDDLILSIDGVRLHGDQQILQSLIASYDPGDVVTMHIVRDNREMRVEVELGEYTRLQNGPARREPALLHRSFELRLRRANVETTNGATPAMQAPVARADGSRAATPRRSATAVGMLPGGEASSVPGQTIGGMPANDGRRRMVAADVRRAQPANAGRHVDPGLIDKLNELNAQIVDLQVKLNDPRTPQDERVKLGEQMQELTRVRQVLVDITLDQPAAR